MAKEQKEQGSGKPPATEQKPSCGIVMPISPMADFPATHWGDVQRILEDAITLAGFSPRVVSTSNVPTIIHKDIVHNLYSDPIVVCDVSGGNPNVMLELGMRLAFDKPTIIVKDEGTRFNFDTSPLRQLEYPRDLRHGRIEEFKSKLADMIRATSEAAKAPGYTSFLKSFGPFKVARIEEVEVSPAAFNSERIFEELASLKRMFAANPRYSSPDVSRNQLAHAKTPEVIRFGVLIMSPIIDPPTIAVLRNHLGATEVHQIPGKGTLFLIDNVPLSANLKHHIASLLDASEDSVVVKAVGFIQRTGQLLDLDQITAL